MVHWHQQGLDDRARVQALRVISRRRSFTREDGGVCFIRTMTFSYGGAWRRMTVEQDWLLPVRCACGG